MTYIKATISDIQKLSPSVNLIEIDLGEHNFSYVPGQWVDVTLAINKQTQNAAFSITSIPNGRNFIEIAVKRVEHLPISAYLHDNLTVGDDVSISEAQGDIVLPEAVKSPLVFLAGGTGITPFISMIRQIFKANKHANATLLYSVTAPDECLFYDELVELRQQHPNFRFFLTTTRTSTHHADFYGRIGSEMLRRAGLDHGAQYYLCGPPQMVDDLAELLLDLSIPKQQIHYEKWW